MSQDMCDTLYFDVVLKHLIRVLVVEDNPMFLEPMKECCANFNLCVVEEATNRHEAEIKLDRSVYDVCILDLGLPQISDGLGILKRFSHKLPICVITGLASAQEGAYCIQLGAQLVQDKPIRNIYQFWNKVVCTGLRHKFLNLATGDPFLVQAVGTLFSDSPSSVAEWAELLGPRANYLHRRWKERAILPKSLVFCHTCIRALINAYFEPSPTSLSAWEKLRPLFDLHRNSLKHVLS